MTSNRTNPGLAVVPAQERSLHGDARGGGGDQSPNERRHQERMARKSSVPPQHRQPQSADAPSAQWDDADWEQEVARRRARRLLSKSNSGFNRVGDTVSGERRRRRRSAGPSVPPSNSA